MDQVIPQITPNLIRTHIINSLHLLVYDPPSIKRYYVHRRDTFRRLPPIFKTFRDLPQPLVLSRLQSPHPPQLLSFLSSLLLRWKCI